MQRILTNIIREISKVLMFTAFWAFPLWVAKDTGNYRYLWLLIISIWGTISLFAHYEFLEKIERMNLQKTHEQDNVGQSEG